MTHHDFDHATAQLRADLATLISVTSCSDIAPARATLNASIIRYCKTLKQHLQEQHLKFHANQKRYSLDYCALIETYRITSGSGREERIIWEAMPAMTFYGLRNCADDITRLAAGHDTKLDAVWLDGQLRSRYNTLRRDGMVRAVIRLDTFPGAERPRALVIDISEAPETESSPHDDTPSYLR